MKSSTPSAAPVNGLKVPVPYGFKPTAVCIETRLPNGMVVERGIFTAPPGGSIEIRTADVPRQPVAAILDEAEDLDGTEPVNDLIGRQPHIDPAFRDLFQSGFPRADFQKLLRTEADVSGSMPEAMPGDPYAGGV